MKNLRMGVRGVIFDAVVLSLFSHGIATAQVEAPAPVEVPQVEVPEVEVPQVEVPQVEQIPQAGDDGEALVPSSCTCPETFCQGGSVEGCSVSCPPSNVGGAVCACGGSCDDDGNPQGVNRCNCQ